MKKWIVLLLVGCMFFSAGCNGTNHARTGDADQTDLAAISENETEGEEEAAEDLEGTPSAETVTASPDEPVAAAFGMDGWGYLNTSGEWVIAPQYLTAYPFVENVATVQLRTGEWQLIDKSGALIAKFPTGIQVFEPHSPLIYPNSSQTASCGCTISDGMIILVRDGDNDGFFSKRGVDLFGYADTAGNIVVKPQYLDAGAFGDGLAPVDIGKEATNGSGKTVILSLNGYIDKTGSMIIEPKFSYASSFSDGMATVQTDEDYPLVGYIDTTGTIQISSDHYQYPYGVFSGGIAPVLTRSGAAVIDKTGTVLGEVPSADQATLNVMSGFFPANKAGFSDGLFPFYDVTMEYNSDTGLYPAGFIDTTGNFAIPAQTEWKVCQGFSNGLCCVYQGELQFGPDARFGYIDTTGQQVIPLNYSKATMFQFDRAIVSTGDISESQWFIIDTSGKTVADLGDTIIDALPFTK